MYFRANIKRFFIFAAICGLALAPLRAYAVMTPDISIGSPCHEMPASDAQLQTDPMAGMDCCDGDNHNTCTDCTAVVAMLPSADISFIVTSNTMLPTSNKSFHSKIPNQLLRPPQHLQ